MQFFFRVHRAAIVVLLALSLGACGGSSGINGTGTTPEPGPTDAPLTPPTQSALERWMASYPDDTFPADLQQQAGGFFEAQAAYMAGDYARANALLDAVWAAHPLGDGSWLVDNGMAGLAQGQPYTALRMLKAVTDWRLQRAGSAPAVEPRPLVMTVVVATESTGNAPANLTEFLALGGAQATHAIDARLLANDAQAVREALWLYGEYLHASTDGLLQLQVRVQTVSVPVELQVRPLAVNPGDIGSAERSGETALLNAAQILAAVPRAVYESTDQWWLIYPGAVPDAADIRDTTWFVSSRMATDDGRYFFIADDSWLLNRSRRYVFGTSGAITTEDRHIYFPDWLHQQFFHQLASLYPEYALMPSPWIARTPGDWPGDFEGQLEADYFHEAMQRRILSTDQAAQALASRLWNKRVDQAFVGHLRVSDLIGRYGNDPGNDWRRGQIESHPLAGQPGEPLLRWRNDANASWNLWVDADENGYLRSSAIDTDATNPYFASRPTMDLMLDIDFQDISQSTIRGIEFDGGYLRQP